MAIELRPHQKKAVADIQAAYIAGYKAPILVMPTGGGKTASSSVIIRMALNKGNRVWFLAHLREILSATSSKLLNERIPHGWIAAGELGDRRQPVQLAMIQTLVRRLDRFEPPNLIIVDEAHLAVAQTYQDIFEWAKAGPKFYRPGGAHILHLTATPQRLDGRGMGEVSDILVPTCSTGDLIEEGLLAPIRYYAPSSQDMSGVRTTGGDFNAGDVANAPDRPRIVGDAVSHYRKLAHGRPAVAFCVSIADAEKAAERFREAGYRAVAISGESDPFERDRALTGLRDGSLDVVCNCALWVAGVDVPSVSCIILLAPTKSLTKYLQSVGRGLRTHPGKDDLIVLDHVGNVTRHGLPTDDREWSLDASVTKRGAADRSEVPVKTCQKCFATVASAATHCRCGFEFPVVAREIETVEGELTEIDVEALRQARKKEQGRAQTEADLVAVGRARGMKRPELWARHVLRARHARDSRLNMR